MLAHAAPVNRQVRPGMQLWSKLCGSSLSRHHGNDHLDERVMPLPEQPLASKADTMASPAEEIAMGMVGLDGYVVEVPVTEPSDIQADGGSVPWYTIPGFLLFLQQRRHKLRLGFARKAQPSVQERTIPPSGATRKITSPPEPLESPVLNHEVWSPEIAASEDSDGTSEGELEGPTTNHVPEPIIDIQGNAGPDTEIGMRHLAMGGMLFAEEQKSPPVGPDSTPRPWDVDLHSSIDSGGSAQNGSQLEAVGESNSAMINESADTGSKAESTRSTGNRPTAPGSDSSEDFCVSAGLIKNFAGDMKSEKLFYDTGSLDHWVAESLVQRHNIPTRPFLPEELTVYDTVGGEQVTPSLYAEISLIDEHHGINEFTKESFNVTSSLGGRGLLLGRKFMKKHGVKLDAKQGPGIYVATARRASEAAKEAQRLLLEHKERDRLDAQQLTAASTAGRTTTETGSSVAEKPAPSSRTSTSSGASKWQPPPKYP